MFRRKKDPEEEELIKLFDLLSSKQVNKGLEAVDLIAKSCQDSPHLVKQYLVPRIPKLLRDRNRRVRSRTVFLLSKLFFATPEFREALITPIVSLLRHNDPVIRLYVAGVLGRIAAITPGLIQPFLGKIVI
jgi:HEAT repeat protein